MEDLDDTLRYLAHFLGPKGENEKLLAELVERVVVEYVNWRKNYQRHDKSLGIQSHFRDDRNKIHTGLESLLAHLKGSFPIYSPRYIGHQLSDTMIASVVGAIAGALYNANNVTPEAGLVSVDLEIEACNALATMLGYRSPPDPPEDVNEDKAYEERLKSDFSWCHLTSGGTVANIEALWVARTIKYFPLAVWDVCDQKKIPLEVELADGTKKDIGDASRWEMLGLKPSASIALLPAFVRALMNKNNLNVNSASSDAWSELEASDYSPAKQPWIAYKDFAPCILVTGAAHYSVKKTVDILGLGRSAIRPIGMLDDFRMDVDDLRRVVKTAIEAKECIIAVIATVGTTEEGAVDPLHKILEVRREVEQTYGQSFWVHADAAWGGFFKTIFVGAGNGKAEFVESIQRLSKFLEAAPYNISLDCDPASDPKAWIIEAVGAIRKRTRTRDGKPRNRKSSKDLVEAWFDQANAEGNYNAALKGLHEFASRLSSEHAEQFEILEADRLRVARAFTEDTLTADYSVEERPFHLSWPIDDDVARAFLAFGKADSITIDPHKMGYQVYPSGAVAFRNDRIRHFIQQKAAYVTLAKTEALAHHPIRRAIDRTATLDKVKSATQAFAPFTLEGSRPSGPACSLWMASKTLPFDRENHGLIVRSSVLAAQYLYELIDKWEWIKSRLPESTAYKLVHFVRHPPDTNIVVFGVMPRTSRFIKDLNECTRAVYEKFSIQKEKGEEESIYTQSFFLSKTEFEEPNYPFETLSHFAKKECRFRNAEVDYKKHGFVVLRASVMNPHIFAAQRILGEDFAMEFMKELDRVAQKICLGYKKAEGDA